MATRPDSKLQHVTIVSRVVKNGVTVTQGVGVKKGATESECDLAASGDNADGIAMETVVGDGVKRVDIALLNGGGVVPVKLSGTATAGLYASCGTGGFQNVTLGGGTVVKYVAGKFTQDGVAGDLVGLAVGQFASVGT